MHPKPPKPVNGAWTQWQREALANEDARKRGITRFAAAIEARVPAGTPSASAPAPAPATAYGGRMPQSAATGLYPQAQPVRNAQHTQRPPANATVGAPHRQQAYTAMASSLPLDPAVLEQAWSGWGQTAQMPQPARTHQGHDRDHLPHQMQQAGNWGAATWGTDAVTDLAHGGGYSSHGWADTRDAGADPAAGGGWGQGAGDPWGQAADQDHKRNPGKHKHHQSADAQGSGGWQDADPGGWSQSGEDQWDMRRKPTSNGWGAFSGAIPEEEEVEADAEDYDDLDDMYTDPDDHRDHAGHKPGRGSLSGISYQYQPLPARQTPSLHPESGPASAKVASNKQSRNSANAGPPALPIPHASQTMNYATDRMTTVFETPPLEGDMSAHFMWSHGAGLEHAQRAFYSRSRLARDRIHWAFNPHKDPRVGSLMHWIDVMSGPLAMIGVCGRAC